MCQCVCVCMSVGECSKSGLSYDEEICRHVAEEKMLQRQQKYETHTRIGVGGKCVIIIRRVQQC